MRGAEVRLLGASGAMVRRRGSRARAGPEADHPRRPRGGRGQAGAVDTLSDRGGEKAAGRVRSGI